MNTDRNTDTCPDCGDTYLVPSTRTYAMLNHMINRGEISVGEARAELASPLLTADEAALLAGWVIDRADQGDHWRAGDPETLPCGCVVSYDREQVDTRCDRPAGRCLLGEVLVDDTDGPAWRSARP